MAGEITTVLLHGAGTGAWVWQAVIHEMTSPVVALDVPGRAEGVTPDSCAAELVAELDRRGIDSVILVLHSLAGVLSSGLASRLGARLKHIVYVAAIVPPSGGSFVDAFGWVNRVIFRLLFRFNRKGLKPSAAMIQRELCNDLDATATDWVVSRYAAEFPGLYLSPTGSVLPRCGTTYIKLLKDQSVLPAQQDAMIARLDNPQVTGIEAGHLVMLSAAARLAELLQREAAPQVAPADRPMAGH
ncbi:MAG: alpha/beta fold hydrolase [Polaromonas sp.]